MSLELDEVSIRCMGCREHQTLEGAIHAEWRICERCQFFICHFCLDHLGETRSCLSYTCQREEASIEDEPIPVDRVLLFARSQASLQRHKGLLHDLFYRSGPGLDLPFVLRENDEAPMAVEEEERPITVQEEVWRNHRLVITKRAGGKFITWEKIV